MKGFFIRVSVITEEVLEIWVIHDLQSVSLSLKPKRSLISREPSAYLPHHWRPLGLDILLLSFVPRDELGQLYASIVGV